MASLFKRGRRYYCRMHVEGRDVWRSLGTADREDATKKAAALENAAKGRHWARRQFHELVARADREIHPDEARVLCEPLVGGVRRLVQLIPSEQRDALPWCFPEACLRRKRARCESPTGGSGGWRHDAGRPSQRQPPSKTARESGGASQPGRMPRASPGSTNSDERTALRYARELWESSMTPRTFNVHV